mmetsp:Transcript_25225/g.34095  ORF Transcript_25225/g.34095 Transcript_25225/m.34095 type:complete len:278 (+) Transcript_25225:201-1034(+)
MQEQRELQLAELAQGWCSEEICRISGHTGQELEACWTVDLEAVVLCPFLLPQSVQLPVPPKRLHVWLQPTCGAPQGTCCRVINDPMRKHTGCANCGPEPNSSPGGMDPWCPLYLPEAGGLLQHDLGTRLVQVELDGTLCPVHSVRHRQIEPELGYPVVHASQRHVLLHRSAGYKLYLSNHGDHLLVVLERFQAFQNCGRWHVNLDNNQARACWSIPLLLLHRKPTLQLLKIRVGQRVQSPSLVQVLHRFRLLVIPDCISEQGAASTLPLAVTKTPLS